MRVMNVVTILTILGISQAQAVTGRHTAQLTFRGAIVEDTCRIYQQQTRIQMTCGSGSQLKTTQIGPTELTVQPHHLSNAYKISQQWINKARGLAIVIIEYS